ncbi:MAG: (deoxy)nucleoside triphosphate pyrophosphohydrolase [Bacteroidia bacterium]|nr:(deoxy)nucleoside triphosphate pyrophosphohydrolase [Bacteroidia bacterium]
MKHVEVVAAIIKLKEKILCVQRGDNKYEYISKKWEFPGGKLEPMETKEQAIIREIKEELHLDIEIESEFLTVYHEYPDFKITMHSFVCKTENDNLTLTEHIDFKWLNYSDIKDLDWAAADIPIVEKLLKFEL